ncbi:hypothetical protein LSTR_LSTR005451 [Laodelphax striatellus]|uniref:N-acylneuraminate cytidylyltransferase n=1 Tax=Laodelphax striatellus TaxID=195883 RepID=A0A482WXQ6_LAOST|nr:hypothetical protein LSTR_LSTR005451 [Laodelphax striatellus]
MYGRIRGKYPTGLDAPNLQRQHNLFHDIWVSTDGHEIADEVEKFGARVHGRDEETATYYAPSILAIKEFLQKHGDIEVIALLQCTSPFTKVDYLTEAFNKIISGEYDSVFSVTRQHKLFWTPHEDGTIIPDNFDVENRPRRQDWAGQLVETGMFYFFQTSLIRHNVLQGGRIGYVEVPKDHSLEIDTEFDLQVARAISRISEGS